MFRAFTHLSICDMNQNNKNGRFARSEVGRPVTDGRPKFTTRFARDAWCATAAWRSRIEGRNHDMIHQYC